MAIRCPGVVPTQERVELTGGTFGAGREGDRWVVRATLPTTPAEVGATQGARQPALG